MVTIGAVVVVTIGAVVVVTIGAVVVVIGAVVVVIAAVVDVVVIFIVVVVVSVVAVVVKVVVSDDPQLQTTVVMELAARVDSAVLNFSTPPEVIKHPATCSTNKRQRITQQDTLCARGTKL